MAIPAESDKPIEQPPNGGTRELKPMEPMEVDLARIVLLGTVLYAVAAVILLPMQSSLTHDGHGRWPWVAVSGVGLGLLGYWYLKRRDRAIARDAAKRADAPSDAPATD
ncbi:DUF2530 domain-containing protein [Actinospica sp.]|uniref:DUF2530 domain-containing protein n=1 Tax=Actinospica sp. TaxID=1872142 RepID=UPI002CF215A3|nr:DUF2530 domain-containing protein [Actinospica sp.]HWG27928.1 DUF2530 domain-containing protein [Actinospica sp.]